MPGPVDELFAAPIPEEVWHYTTLAGLEGILSSNKIWATDAAFTTDSSEFVHARDVAASFLNSLSPSDEHVAFAKQAVLDMVTKTFDDGVLSRKHTEVFVASFSAAADLKSQWIEYADGGRGVSIAFDLRAVRPPADLKLGVTLAPCVYAQRDKERLVEAALSRFVEAAAKHHRLSKDGRYLSGQMRTFAIIERMDGRPLDKDRLMANLTGKVYAEIRHAAVLTAFDLLRLASHCKDNSFRQEEEWRLALPRSTDRPLVHVKIEFRGPRDNIPYLAFDLFQQNGHLPITKVMTGPLCKDRTKVDGILTSGGYDVPVVESGIPLRDPNAIA